MMISGSDKHSFAALLNATRNLIQTWRMPDRSQVVGRTTAPVVPSGARRRAAAMMLCFIANTAWMPDSTSAQNGALTRAVETSEKLRQLAVEAERAHREEVLWLARAIYSETKRPHEQELVAWIVRNRVDTGYRGDSTYEATVLDPYQFSAFNPNTDTRAFYVGLDWNSKAIGFQTALSIAWKVASADEDERPFSKSTRHFYSARSMAYGKAPAWAEDKHPIKLDRVVDAERFRFYERIA